jgi:hypothetical protein
MPTSIREQVMAALKAQLAGLAGVTVERNRAEEFPADKLPALNLIDGGHAAGHGVHGLTGYLLTATIEGFAQAATGEAAATALNDLYAKVVDLFDPDATLGGLVLRVDETRLEVELDRGTPEEPQAAFSLDLELEFHTRPGDPYTLGP